MSTALDKSRIRRLVALGIMGGLAGSALMAMYAMIVSAVYKDVGFFTPLYHIGSAFLSPQAMRASMEAAAAGSAFTFDAGPALVGLMVHMVTGAAAGAAFGLLVAVASPRRALVVAAGAAYGVVVMLANALVGLPLVAALFGGGEAISDMPAMAGWGTFFAEHLIYGVALGVVVATSGTRRAGREVQRPAVSMRT